MTVDDKAGGPDVRDVEPTKEVEIGRTSGETDEPASTADKKRQHETATGKAEPIGRRVLRWLPRTKLVPVVLIVLLAVAAGLATWVYFQMYRPEQLIDPSVEHDVVTAASDGTVALLSYAPDTVDKDFATARSHLTGDFLSYYEQFTQEIVAPAAKEKAVHTSAKVMAAAMSELHPDSAVVLVFVDQQTTSKDKPDPSMSASSVRVTLNKVNGAWLISKFDPV